MKNDKSIPIESDYIHIREAKKILGVSTQTLHNWDKQGKIRTARLPSNARIYHKEDVFNIARITTPTTLKKKICYCRVSSKKQMDDLERQKYLLQSQFPTHIMVTDIGSGINWKRKGLQTILESAMSRDIEEVVVAHRDRLCRFAFELIQFILENNGVKLIVLDTEDGKSTEQELSEDILSIVHIYSCRSMGRRRYKSKENSSVSNQESKEDNDELDRNC
jgi:putative resolvase